MLNKFSIEKERMYQRIVSAVLGVGLMALCLPTPGTASIEQGLYRSFNVAEFALKSPCYC